MLARCTLIGCTVLYLAACGGSTQDSPQPKKPNINAVVSKDKDGNVIVTVLKDGQPTWPPVGDGCDAFVACCKDAVALKTDFDLECKLLAPTMKTCEQGREITARSVASKGLAVPDTCH